MTGRNYKGFTILEALVVVAIALIVTTASLIIIPNVLNSTSVDSGYSLTIGALRQARQLAIDQMEQVQVTFGSGSAATITVQNQMPGTGGSGGSGSFFTVGGATSTTVNGFQYANLSTQITLPPRVKFSLPTTGMNSLTAPEDVPTGQWQLNTSVPISFTPLVVNGSGGYSSPIGNSAGYVIVFQPDGTARCSSSGGSQCTGVVYLSDVKNTVSNIKAVTLFGATGRIQGYRYNPAGSGSTAWSPY